MSHLYPISRILLLISLSIVSIEAVQYLWYPVPVKISPPTSTYLRRSPGQSVHFQVHNVQDGSYHFGYDADTARDKSYREEKRDAFGRVTGSYGYIDPDGTLRVVEYVADEGGFRTRTSNKVPAAIVPEPIIREPLQVIGPIPKPFSEFFHF